MSYGLLLDTCTFVWLVSDQTQLSGTAKQLIRAQAGALFLSAISAWEIALKVRKGQLVLSHPPKMWIDRGVRKHGISELPVDAANAVLSVVGLPNLHKDPADRIILAAAQIHDLEILTPDHLIADYPSVVVRW